MTVTYGTVFSEEQYLEIAKRVGEYFRESSKSRYFPLIETEISDVMQYRHRVEADADASYGTLHWTSGGTKAKSKFGYEDFTLNAIQMEIEIPNNNINQYNSDNFLADAYAAQLRKWDDDIDNSAFHGVLDEDGDAQLNEGILGSVTTTQNISSAGDEDLSTKGEIYLGIKTMIESIPFRIRESLPNGVDLFVSSNLDSEVRAPDRIYQDKIEFDFIYENFIGPKASPALKIRNYIVTDKILTLATDATTGVNANTVDTQGTHDRILVAAPDPRIIGRVVSKWDMIGEQKRVLDTLQIWGFRGRTIVFDTNGVKFSEALTV